MRDYTTLRYRVASSGVATIALDSPATRNALSDAVLVDLLDALEAVRHDPDARCLVLASTHPTVFCAGGSLGGLSKDVPPLERHTAAARFPAVLKAISGLGKPSLCAASGHVLAGGMGLALACDLVIAKETARFGTPEIGVGLFPFMVMALLYRNVGRKKAAELMLRGSQISAHEAERIGIVNCVASADDFDNRISEWATELAQRSPLIMRLGKEAISRQQDMGFDAALEYLRSQLTLAASSDDASEGIAAFFERREPVWTGR